MKRARLGTKLLFALSALAVFATSYYLGNRYARPGGTDLQAFALPQPQKIQPFQLRDKNGEMFDARSFEGHWNFVMAGDLKHEECRSLLVRYVLAWNHLAAKPKLQKKTRVVFLDTADPLPSQELKTLIEFFNPAFTAVNGKREEWAKLAAQLGISRQSIDSGIPCDSRNGVVALINPDGYLLALFTAVTDPATIASDLLFFQ